jgi:hypothetical protein
MCATLIGLLVYLGECPVPAVQKVGESERISGTLPHVGSPPGSGWGAFPTRGEPSWHVARIGIIWVVGS